MASLVALLVDIVLALGLIPIWGVWGAVVANVSAAAVQMFVLLSSELSALELPMGHRGPRHASGLPGERLRSWRGTPRPWYPAASGRSPSPVGSDRRDRPPLAAGALGPHAGRPVRRRSRPSRATSTARRGGTPHGQVARRSGRARPSSTPSTAATVSAQRNRSVLEPDLGRTNPSRSRPPTPGRPAASWGRRARSMPRRRRPPPAGTPRRSRPPDSRAAGPRRRGARTPRTTRGNEHVGVTIQPRHLAVADPAEHHGRRSRPASAPSAVAPNTRSALTAPTTTSGRGPVPAPPAAARGSCAPRASRHRG